MKNFAAGLVLLALSAPSIALEITVGPTLTMDPVSRTPLAGLVDLETDVPTRLSLTISDGARTWAVNFPDFSQNHEGAVLGLKPDSIYNVEVVVYDQAGNALAADAPLIAVTGPLPADFPNIDVLTSVPAAMEAGFTLTDQVRRGANSTAPVYSIIFDENGEVVWYSIHAGVNNQHLPNGDIRYRSNDELIEIDMLGRTTRQITLQTSGFDLHHDLETTPQGTILSTTHEIVTVENYPTSDTDPTAPTQTAQVEDNPIEEFAQDGSLLNTWRLVDILDPLRISYSSLGSRRGQTTLDWIHVNAVSYDSRDDTMIISGRHQDAVVKFRRTGEIVWILGPHANWSSEYQQYLLSPIGAPFEWQYHEHAPEITANGTLILFDNGNFRASPFDGNVPMEETDSYSRAVEYSIDEASMEVRQVWDSGSFGERLYTAIISDADLLPVTNNVLTTFGFVSYVDGVASADLGLGAGHTRIIELTHTEPAQAVFDIRISDPADQAAVYRADRIVTLYASGVTIDHDSDGDHVLDSVDNCRLVPNPDQRDTNGDGFGNMCDADLNNDGFVNFVDLGAIKGTFLTGDPDSDFDGDGIVNFVDLQLMKESFFKAPGPGGLAQ